MQYKIYTLGCKVNEYESEFMGFLLENHGYVKGEKPNVVIVNTCSVTNTADSKSRKIIRRVRKEYPNSLLVVVGCMTQNKKDLDIDADIVLGNINKSEIITYIENFKDEKIFDIRDMSDAVFEDMSLNDFNLTRAYIKIQDGCDNYCSYCIIPYVRGHVRCKKREDVLTEAHNLVSNGHKEIVLTGIHTGNYHDGDYDFSDLLTDLVKIDGLKRLRISSVEVTELDDKFLNVLKNGDILVDHMHIPLQSGSDRILRLMNRKYDISYFISKIKKIREIRPNISITTDVIVGFPSETEKDFLECIETIKEVNFSKLHVFPYSDRDGTMASKMKDKVNGIIKKERVKKLLSLSKELELNYMNKFLNKELCFIPEIYDDGYLIGHTGNYLLVKALGNEELLGKEVLAISKSIAYPYLVSDICLH